MPRSVLSLAAFAAAVALAACADLKPVTSADERAPAARVATPLTAQSTADVAATTSYVIDFTGTTLPGDLATQVAAAGGTLTASISQIGVAVASSSNPDFATRAAKIRGVASVDADVEVQWVPQERVLEAGEVVESSDPGAAASFGSAETFRNVQWAPDAVFAPGAWDLGARGAGARVAIVDGGIRDTHADIAPNLDAARSRSFVPGQPFNFDQARNAAGQCVLNDTFWHGTHVAGIVAAPGGNTFGTTNNIGTVGIAPSATIIGVKVLHCGSGSFAAVIAGIVYAATPIAEGGAGADIINMSLGAQFPRQGAGLAHLAVAIGKATTYADQRGVTVIAALGNNATDLDHTANTIFVPAMSPHVISVAATAPLGFALGARNFDRPASYTNFGQSAVDFAGPGGDFALPGNDICSIPRNPSGSVTTACWVFDLVIAPCRGSGTSNTTYCFAAGTSMASPAVAGVAALIVGKYGHVGAAEVTRRLRQSADDINKPGNDDFAGGGRVNALRAVQ